MDTIKQLKAQIHRVEMSINKLEHNPHTEALGGSNDFHKGYLTGKLHGLELALELISTELDG